MHSFIILVSKTSESEVVEPETRGEVEVEAVEPEETEDKQPSMLKYQLLQIFIYQYELWVALGYICCFPWIKIMWFIFELS